MTASTITPLLVPTSPTVARVLAARPRRPLPIATVPVPRPPDAAVYGMAAMDDRGRIADRSVLRVLGWDAGTRVRVDVDSGIAVVSAEPNGPSRITTSSHLRLAASVRHRLGLRPGDRMLLSASPTALRLRLYPPAALDAFLASAGSTGGLG